MKTYRSILFILLLASCNNNDSSQVAEAPAVANKKDAVHYTDELPVHSSNPDTALAIFLYKNYLNFDPITQMEQYIRWDLENEMIKPLVSLYLQPEDKEAVLDVLQKNRLAFQEKAAAKVMDDYKQKGAVSGRLFSYLAEKRDPVVEPLLQDLLNNPKASKEEKEYARRVLKGLKNSSAEPIK